MLAKQIRLQNWVFVLLFAAASFLFHVSKTSDHESATDQSIETTRDVANTSQTLHPLDIAVDVESRVGDIAILTLTIHANEKWDNGVHYLWTIPKGAELVSGTVEEVVANVPQDEIIQREVSLRLSSPTTIRVDANGSANFTPFKQFATQEL